MDNHEGMTRMLFVDAIVGVGFPCHEAGMVAEYQGLAECTSDQRHESWAWKRAALEALSTPALQELYTSLKLYEVIRAD